MCATHILPRERGREPGPARRRLSRQAACSMAERRAELPQSQGARRLGAARRTSPAARSFVRAFAPRLIHVLPGNSPGVAVKSIAQGALVKAINLFKMSSSDPFTTVAILRTMAEIDPDHPIVQSMSAVYWRGGDDAVERMLYRPQYFDKIVAWGGGDAINNVIKYLGPGLPAGLVRSQDLDLDDRQGGLRVRRDARSRSPTSRAPTSRCSTRRPASPAASSSSRASAGRRSTASARGCTNASLERAAASAMPVRSTWSCASRSRC